MKYLTFLIILLPLSNCQIDDDRPNPLISKTPVDFEGYEYPTVQIGNQVWMAENLKTSKYQNGDEIATTSDLHVDLAGWTNPKYQWSYLGIENYIADYGRLYTWYAIMDPRGVCPEGWQIPNNQDWINLAEYLGGEDIAGNALKEIGSTYWHPPNEGATNETGFSAIPAGYRKLNGEFGAIGYRARWWSSTESPPINAWRFGVAYDRRSATLNDLYSKAGGYSVRCLRYE